VPAAILASALFHAPSMSQVGTVNGILIHGANVGTLLGAPGFAAVVSYTGGWSGGALLFLAMGSASAILALIVGGLERRLARAAAPTE
jgi:chemotaxis protein CheY-P-specific phosphatase CheC